MDRDIILSGMGIWLVGGGKLIDQFIKQNMIDKYIITIIPTTLSKPVSLVGIVSESLNLYNIGGK